MERPVRANSAEPVGEATLTPAGVEAIARRAAEIVIEELSSRSDGSSPWLAGAAAAGAYLGVPAQRIFKRLAEIPHRREGSRLFFRRDELDAWLDEHREGR